MLEHPSLLSARRRTHSSNPHGPSQRRDSNERHPHPHLDPHPLHDANKEIEPSTLDSLGVLPVPVANEDTRDDTAKPGEVLKDLLLRVPANIRARAHKRRRNRRMYVGLMRSVLPEHPRYALVVRRCVPQHRCEVRLARRAHRERLRQCGRVDTRNGHVCRVPLQRP